MVLSACAKSFLNWHFQAFIVWFLNLDSWESKMVDSDSGIGVGTGTGSKFYQFGTGIGIGINSFPHIGIGVGIRMLGWNRNRSRSRDHPEPPIFDGNALPVLLGFTARESKEYRTEITCLFLRGEGMAKSGRPP